MKHPVKPAGKVFIVGAGPGADDLVTLRGLHALQQAEVILYDALMPAKLLEQAPSSAERIYVGKRCGRHSLKQEEITRLILAKAREGKIVVRLKGGDPLIFGRGGEEALACAEAGVDFEIVPGVSAVLGAAAFAGIPLTHRGIASSVAFVTAHGARCGESPDLSWINLANAVDTLVIFMGSAWLGRIADALIESGLPGTRPVAVVSNATCESQVTVLGTLETIAEQVAQAGLETPMLIIVGEVTRLSEALNWFKRQQAAARLPVLP
ncbi:MAG TPA: uroporphyrinogen-III C-methyltransferase [Terriglobia bacterium]|nr:uroporphyrinogen-III C-methyltransferase [Terriglobia bacterium]